MMNVTLTLTKSSFFADGEVKDYHHFDILANGEKVGTLSIIDHFNDGNDVAYVERIDIDEAFRGQGIGTTVLTSLLKETYSAVVTAPDNEDAKRLYERIGEEYSGIYGVENDFSYEDQGFGVYTI